MPADSSQTSVSSADPSTFDAGQRRQHILNLALPIIGAMISQNILNLADTAMVGALSTQALAAVGLGSFLNWMAMAFITGLATGVQAIASRRLGEGKESELAVPLNGGLLLSLLLALPWSLALFFLAPWIVSLINPDPAVVAIGGPYLQVRLLGMVAVAMNFAFRGFWNGVNISAVYMRTLIVMHSLDLILSWVLIFGWFGLPKMGATGAGLGTTIAIYVGTLMYAFQAWQIARNKGFLKRLPDRQTLLTMLKISIPSGIQQLFFSAGMTCFFWIVGLVGTAELAASNVLINLLLVAILPGMAFGITAASLVGQALGRKNPDDANRWAWDVSKLASLAVGLLTLPAVVFPEFFLQLFLHEPQALQLAVWPLRIVALTIAWDTMGSVLMQALLGAGDSKSVMLASVALQWLVYLPLLFVLVKFAGMGMTGIWILQVAYRGIQTLVFYILWQNGKWRTLKV